MLKIECKQPQVGNGNLPNYSQKLFLVDWKYVKIFSLAKYIP